MRHARSFLARTTVPFSSYTSSGTFSCQTYFFAAEISSVLSLATLLFLLFIFGTGLSSSKSAQDKGAEFPLSSKHTEPFATDVDGFEPCSVLHSPSEGILLQV
jgi:hypothetical protein